jgi:hypothetical protein
MRCSSLPHLKHLGLSRGGLFAWVTLLRTRFHRRPCALEVSIGTTVLFIHGGALVELIGLGGGWVFGRGKFWNEFGLLVLGRLQLLFCVCAVRGGPQTLEILFAQFTASTVAFIS